MKLRRAQQILDAKQSRQRQQVLKEENAKKRAGEMRDIIKRQNEFPRTLRVAIKEAHAVYRGDDGEGRSTPPKCRESFKIARFFSYFDTKVGCFFLRDNGYGSYKYGPDDRRDTDDEIETAVRYYLSTASGKKNAKKIIVAQSRNFHGVSFIPMFARIGKDRPELFTDKERGGLITNEGNIVNELAKRNYTDYNKRKDPEHQRIIDEKFLAVIERLREMNLFTKNDVRRNHLLYAIFHSGTSYFAERRFRYLVNWNPAAFAKYFTPTSNKAGNEYYNFYRTNVPTSYLAGLNKKNPLHSIVHFHPSIDAFRTVFDLTMQHFPLRIGWMFRKDSYGETPFQRASAKYGADSVRTILDETLNDQTRNDEHFILKSYVIAASDDAVDVECDYILLQRDPSILKPQPPPPQQPSSDVSTTTTTSKKTYWISGAVLRNGMKRKRNNATTFFDSLYLKSFLRGQKRRKKNGSVNDKSGDDMDWYEVEFLIKYK